jgi:AcrR family transcriptional regulator
MDKSPRKIETTMAYSKSKVTKKAIIDASGKLFYQMGYNTTQISAIAAEAGVNQGLIHYYYKSKDRLAEIVFTDILMKMLGQTTTLFPDENLLVKNALSLRVYFHSFIHNAPFRRFIYEISLKRIPVQLAWGVGQEYFAAINTEYNLGLNEDMLRLLCISTFSLETAMFIGYSEGYIKLTETELVDFDIKSTYVLMSLPYHIIDEVLDKSSKLFAKLNVRCGDEFKITLSLK